MATNPSPNRHPAGSPSGGRFASGPHPESELSLTSGTPDRAPETRPPTRLDVEQARRRVAALGTPVPPMYRQDWGGRTPTVAQHRARVDAADATNAPIREARAHYERLRAAWDASDKSQDATAIECWNCKAAYDALDHFECPECGEEER